MCKILVQNFIIKDILKKKNDVHYHVDSVAYITTGKVCDHQIFVFCCCEAIAFKFYTARMCFMELFHNNVKGNVRKKI